MSEQLPPPRGVVRDRLARAALLIAVVTVAARFTGFLRVLVFARTVGPSCLGDTYYTANAIPNIVFDVVAGGALSSLVVPVLAPAVDRGDEAAVDRTVSALLTWAALILVPVMALGVLLAHPLVAALIGGGHSGCSTVTQARVGARMLLVFMPQVVLYGAGIVLTGVLQVHRRFAAPAWGPLVSSLVVIATYLTYAAVATGRESDLSTLTRPHELILSVGTTLGVVGLVAPLLLPLRRTGVRLRPAVHFPSGVAPVVRRMVVSGAVVLGSQQLATAVVLRLANSYGAAGSVVLFNLAWTVILLPWAVLAVPLATSAFPRLSSLWQRGERGAYGETAALTLRSVVLTSCAAAGILVGVAQPAARLVVLGAPGGADPVELARGLIAFAPGVVGFATVALTSRALYAQNDARTPAVATAAGWGLTVLTATLGVRATAGDGTVAALGAAISLGVTLTACRLAHALRRSAGKRVVEGLRRALLAGVVGAAAAAVAGAALAAALGPGGTLRSLLVTVGCALGCAVVFAATARVLDAATCRLLVGRVRHALR